MAIYESELLGSREEKKCPVCGCFGQMEQIWQIEPIRNDWLRQNSY